jgi:polysaccharide deacetylase 2 family uncharacterized protein YibQ
MKTKAVMIAAALCIILMALGLLVYLRSAHAPRKIVVLPKHAAAKRPPKSAGLPAVQKKFTNPKVAIVMDDFGYNMKDLDQIFAARLPVTFSVLPNLKYSRRVAQLAHSKGFEVILHLPLEANGSSAAVEADTIKTSMGAEQITSMLDQEISDVPYLKGISNHQGSKATEDGRTMSIIMEGLKKKGLYFFDSFCTSKSVCRDVARAEGIKYGRRDVFLDDVNTPEAIEKELLRLRKIAFKKGRAIAVCHDRKGTIAVLGRMMPLLAEDGVVFVYLSDMVN